MPKSTTTTAAAKESGTALLDTLYKLLESELGHEPTKAPNKSETYTRLLVGSKAYAYIFPPADSRLAVKIPKQLLAVERDLPKSHGFKRTGWGLTRSVTKASELPVVAKALAVAAAAVAPQPVSDSVEKLPPASAPKPEPQPEPTVDGDGPAVTPGSVVVRQGRDVTPVPKPKSTKRSRGKRQTTKA